MKYTLILDGVRVSVLVDETLASKLTSFNGAEDIKFQFVGQVYKVVAVIVRFGRVNFAAEKVASNNEKLVKIFRDF